MRSMRVAHLGDGRVLGIVLAQPDQRDLLAELLRHTFRELVAGDVHVTVGGDDFVLQSARVARSATVVMSHSLSQRRNTGTV